MRHFVKAPFPAVKPADLWDVFTGFAQPGIENFPNFSLQNNSRLIRSGEICL